MSASEILHGNSPTLSLSIGIGVQSVLEFAFLTHWSQQCACPSPLSLPSRPLLGNVGLLVLVMPSDKASLYQEHSICEGTCPSLLTGSVTRSDMSEQGIGRRMRTAVPPVRGHILRSN